MTELRAVTFDCWHTLLVERDPQRAFDLRFAGFRRLLEQAGLPVRRESADAALTDAWQRHADAARSGTVTRAKDVARWAVEPFGLGSRAAPVVASVARLLAETTSEPGVAALPGAYELLFQLQERGVKIGLICNSGLIPGSVTRSLLRAAHLERFFEVQIFSDEMGMLKPDARLFHQALSQLEASAAQALHIGDDLRTDVQGARAAGMATVRLRAARDDRSKAQEADHLVETHAALGRLLSDLAASPR